MLLTEQAKPTTVERRTGARPSLRIAVTVFTGDNSEAAHSLDLGLGGVRLLTSHPLCAGLRPTLVLPLPGGVPVMAAAEVLETTECGEGWVCRLAFTSLRPLDLKRLQAVVDDPLPVGDRSARGAD